MNEVLFNTMIDAVDAHEKKMNELNEKVEQVRGYAEMLHRLSTNIDEIKVLIQEVSFPHKEIQDLSNHLQANITYMKQPVKREVIHHHHATKFTWVAVALFLIVCLTSCGWYMTTNTLTLYIANDTKYRYLKLHDNKTLTQWLGFTDSLYVTDSRMREVVLSKEEQKQRDNAILQRAIEMEKEAMKLKQQLKKKEATKARD